jgi:hypothetical protein
MTPRRYLVPFGPKASAHRFTDVLVVGAGIAGLRAALAVPDSLGVLVVTKDRIDESNSAYAQGGIAGVLGPDDRFEDHVEDTRTAGAGLCEWSRRCGWPSPSASISCCASRRAEERREGFAYGEAGLTLAIPAHGPAPERRKRARNTTRGRPGRTIKQVEYFCSDNHQGGNLKYLTE